LKPKDEKETSKSIKDTAEEVDVKQVTQKAFDLRKLIDTAVDLAQPRPVKTTEYIPKSECLMTTFYLLTNKSFPRKGPGKSTRVKMLDAIIMAAINKKLILQEA
jgi:hypothetical protein